MLNPQWSMDNAMALCGVCGLSPARTRRARRPRRPGRVARCRPPLSSPPSEAAVAVVVGRLRRRRASEVAWGHASGRRQRPAGATVSSPRHARDSSVRGGARARERGGREAAAPAELFHRTAAASPSSNASTPFPLSPPSARRMESRDKGRGADERRQASTRVRGSRASEGDQGR